MVLAARGSSLKTFTDPAEAAQWLDGLVACREEGEVLEPIGRLAERHLGDRPNPKTIQRWVLRGLNGVRLPAVKVLRQHRSTDAAFVAWLDLANQADPSRSK